MPKISEMRESKFLKKEDVGRGALGTIASCQQMNVAMEGAGQELKWCLTFADIDKPLVLNSTNIQLCAQICGLRIPTIGSASASCSTPIRTSRIRAS